MLTLTVTLALACVLGLIAVLILAIAPSHEFAALGNSVNGQSQTAKTLVYVLAFAVVLPLAVAGSTRLADRIASGPNADGVTTVAGLLAAALLAAVIAVRVSSRLPWGDGLGTLLGAIGLWAVFAVAVLTRASAFGQWPALLGAARYPRTLVTAIGLLALATLLCVTDLNAVNAPALIVGVMLTIALVAAYDRIRLARPRRGVAIAIDVVVVLLLFLAVPNVVVFHPSIGPPNLFVEPGLVQSQHDFFLGPVNQLIHGGALLVNAPGSQYGVGDLYFLAGWFHLVGIGYGTFGLLDGILTALFYIAAYCVLRIVGVSRVLAVAAMALGVVALVYHLQYAVGVLPEQGPLRFGLPIVLLCGVLTGVRWPRARPAARAAAFATLGVSSIWAVETLGFTLAALLAVLAVETWLLPAGTRGRWLLRQSAWAVVSCLAAHVAFAAATLAGSGHLPDWGQYFNYVHSFLLGGKAGQVTYGFANWSPALAVGAAALASAAAIVLLIRRAPSLGRRAPLTMIAVSGTTGYAIALFAYVDSRSSTYYLPYIALPTLLTGVLWLHLLTGSAWRTSRLTRLASLACALAVAALMVSAAWPSVSGRFSDSALRHAVPGGGLRSAIDRLVHPPAIDPRTPVGEAVLARYVPGRRPVLLFASDSDLATEILMHGRLANRLAIGDPGMDSYVPSNWIPTIGPEIDALRPGTRVLLDPAAVRADATLRAHPSVDPLKHPLILGGTELEWILKRIARRFRLAPVYRDSQGFVVAQLVPDRKVTP